MVRHLRCNEFMPMKWCFFIVLFYLSSHSYETDQFTVAKHPLKDIGSRLSTFIYQNLQQGILEVNQNLKSLPGQIQDLQNQLAEYPQDLDQIVWIDHPQRAAFIDLKAQLSRKKELLAQLRTDLGVVAYLQQKYALTITWNEQRDGVFGLPVAYASLNKNETYADVYFNQGRLDTIYSFAGFHRIISPSYFVFASTVNAYGTYMGIDKFGHFINQGFEYFQLFHESLAQGLDPQQSLKKIVQWGVETEDGLFGSIVDGVYSNGDLAANFAGFIFYQNFLQPLKINNQIYPQIIKKGTDGAWLYSDDIENSKEQLLKRFMSDHFDESLNGSIYERPQKYFIVKAIKTRCQSWKDFYAFKTKTDFFIRTQKLQTWHGFDYGHKSEGLIDIPSLCFF